MVNLSSGKSFTVKEIVKTIINVFGKDLEINYDLTKPSRKYGLKVNSDKAKSLFGWKSKYDLERGINEIKDIGV